VIINVGICATFLIVLTIIVLVYFSKPKINTIENNIFKRQIGVTAFGLLLEAIIYFLITNHVNLSQNILIILTKMLYVYYVFWMYYFVKYNFVVFFKDKIDDKKMKNVFSIITIFYIIFFIISIVLPINYTLTNTYYYPGGIGTLLQYVIVTLGMSVIGMFGFMNFKKIKTKESLPMIICMILGIISIVVQYFYHEFLFIVPSHAIAVILMYFTIENPDVKMLRQIELAKDQAERANHAKSDFLSSMSHEIRTPLNAIVGFSEDIQSRKDTCDPEIVEDANYILEASKTLLEIVGNILDINKIEANKMEITEVKYNFKEEIESLAKIDATRIGEKNINFKINLASDIPYELIGDKTHIKEIVNNLLTNAIKYTEQGEIELNVKCINKDKISTLIISVRDTGRGIKAENINKLFTKFERLDAERNSTTEGTGLGLAITKALVEMMGGKINVQSQFGQGSMFVVQIPQKISQMVNPDQTVQINIAPIKQAMEESKQETVMPQPTTESVATQSTLSVENKSINYFGKKILIVDDNKLNIKVARRALDGFDFEIDECYDGQECLDKLPNGNEYDLILMDIMMPNMSGETAIAKLKEKPNFNIPTIALTADAVAGAKEKYIGEGFIDYIAKPFSKDQIKEKLDMVFNSSEPKQAEVKKDELEEALSDMSKPIQEIELPNQSDTTPKYDPNVDRFKDAATYVFDSTKKDDENQQ